MKTRTPALEGMDFARLLAGPGLLPLPSNEPDKLMNLEETLYYLHLAPQDFMHLVDAGAPGFKGIDTTGPLAAYFHPHDLAGWMCLKLTEPPASMTLAQAAEAAHAVGCSLARHEDEVVISCREYQALAWIAFPELLAYRLKGQAQGLQVAPERLAEAILSDWHKKARECAARVLQIQAEGPKGEARVMLGFHRPALEFMAGVSFAGWALEGCPLPLVEPKAAKKKGGC